MNIHDYEIKEARELYGNDKHAINRHSVRQYQVPGNTAPFYLNKTLDGSPPFYELYVFDRRIIGDSIPVNGQQYWGEGLTWSQAEELAGKAIEGEFARNA